ncbi:MAG TPA: hypothetical protein PK425_02260 [Syntrophales bacterium]|jgi:hypothetical protein|nr:hypothetical protein [Syntrophales bacterium]HPX55338.1 hypothetical protein [Syntrophales bacterium]HQA81746.1 hypothetical protein [Syntrophales bacterium]
MLAMDLTQEEVRALLEILERYFPELRREVVNTDDREFRRSLKVREQYMKQFIERLKEMQK